MNKDTPLLPLEYCRIDRAARLLGCETEDILHWGATSKISLRILVEHRPLGTHSDDEDVLSRSTIIYTGYPHLEIVSAFRDGGRFHISNHASMCIYPHREEEEVRKDPFGGYLSITVADIKGIWRVPSSVIEKLYHGTDGVSFPVYESYSRKGAKQDRGYRCFTALQYNCDQQNFAQVKNHLIVMADDLALLHKHITNGEPIPVNKKQVETDSKAMSSSAETTKTRVTANQSKAIIELLTTHGFTDKDYGGGLEALQRKIASKGLSETLTNIDRNTLKTWLEKAGVR